MKTVLSSLVVTAILIVSGLPASASLVGRRSFLLTCAGLLVGSSVKASSLGLQSLGDDFERTLSESPDLATPAEIPALRRLMQDQVWDQIQAVAVQAPAQANRVRLSAFFSIRNRGMTVQGRQTFSVVLGRGHLNTERGRERIISEIRRDSPSEFEILAGEPI